MAGLTQGDLSVLNALRDGLIYMPDDYDAHNLLRVRISRLRKLGYVIEGVRRKRGVAGTYRLVREPRP